MQWISVASSRRAGRRLVGPGARLGIARDPRGGSTRCIFAGAPVHLHSRHSVTHHTMHTQAGHTYISQAIGIGIISGRLMDSTKKHQRVVLHLQATSSSSNFNRQVTVWTLTLWTPEVSASWLRLVFLVGNMDYSMPPRPRYSAHLDSLVLLRGPLLSVRLTTSTHPARRQLHVNVQAGISVVFSWCVTL